MTTKRKFKSEVFEAIHSSASAMLKVGALDKATMRHFDASCLAVPQSFKKPLHKSAF
jgi:putative transcriptional regulator